MKVYYTTLTDMTVANKYLISFDQNCLARFFIYMLAVQINRPTIQVLRERIEARLGKSVELLPSNQETAYEDETIKVQSL